MRLHVVALPHTQTTAAFSSCAYTQKVVKWTKMMRARGHHVILYGAEVNEAECDEHVVIVTERERRGWFGDGFDTVLTPLSWDPAEVYWTVANDRAGAAIEDRLGEERDELLCLIGGWSQVPIAQRIRRQCVEWGVGYEGIIPGAFRAFESYAWMHHVYGLQQQRFGGWYDTVIPNFFDLADFTLGDGAGGYLLYLGRLVERKGFDVAALIAARCGRKLVIAGPGATTWGPGFVEADGLRVEGELEYVGEVGITERAELLAGAAVLVAPTKYLEPFGGAVVEAMLAGTPAVTSDFGAFTETVEHGVTGCRFRTLAEAAAAVDRAVLLPREEVRQRAASRYALEPVALLYDEWFERLDGLFGAGWTA